MGDGTWRSWQEPESGCLLTQGYFEPDDLLLGCCVKYCKIRTMFVVSLGFLIPFSSFNRFLFCHFPLYIHLARLGFAPGLRRGKVLWEMTVLVGMISLTRQDEHWDIASQE